MPPPLVRFQVVIIVVFLALALGSRQITYSLPPAWIVVALNLFITGILVWIGRRTQQFNRLIQKTEWDWLGIGICSLAIITCVRGFFTVPSFSSSAIIGYAPSTREAVICGALIWYYAGRILGKLSLTHVGPICLIIYAALYLSGLLFEDVTIVAFHIALFACLSLSEQRRIALLGILVAIGLMIVWQVWGGALVLCLAMAWKIEKDLSIFTQNLRMRIWVLLGFVGVLALIVAAIPPNGYDSRIKLWSEALSDIYAHPWLGSGIGRVYLSENCAGFTHNTPLTLLVEMGVIGIIPFFIILQGLRDHWARYPTWLQSTIICLSAWS